MSIAKYCVDTGPYIAPNTTYPVGVINPGGYDCALGPIRYLDVNENLYQIQLFNNWWNEQINQYGQQVNYYINLYSLSAQDFFYGEQPLAGYYAPVPMIMAVTVNNDSIILSKFGIQGQADVTAMITIQTFTSMLTGSALSAMAQAYIYEPKAGDLIELIEYGSTRPNGRSGQIFEITERVDQQGGQFNQLMGHYIWIIRGKRYAYDYEPASPRENLSDQVYDNKYEGLAPLDAGTPGTDARVIETKLYGQNVDNYTRNNVYDYNVNANVGVSGYMSFSGYSGTTGKPNTNVYGSYEGNITLVDLYGASINSQNPSAAGVENMPNTYIGLPSPNN